MSDLSPRTATAGGSWLTRFLCSLGHFGLLFAKALGANVTAISHSESKKADAEKMGATRFIATHSGKEDDFAPYKRSLDLIICTTNDKEMPILGYLSLLRPGGHLIRECLISARPRSCRQFLTSPSLRSRRCSGEAVPGSPGLPVHHEQRAPWRIR